MPVPVPVTRTKDGLVIVRCTLVLCGGGANEEGGGEGNDEGGEAHVD